MTSPTTSAQSQRVPMERLALEFPRSLLVVDSYSDAQHVVDSLSDHQFPVENVMIVGTDLKQVERVTGRLTWGKVLMGGILSGMWLGLFVGLLLSMFASGDVLPTILSAVLTGAVFGLVWASIGYAFTRGNRDFTSVTQVVATRYEVLVEHRLFDRARETLQKLPGSSVSLAPAASETPEREPRPNPYEGRYGAMREESGTRGAHEVARPSQGGAGENGDERLGSSTGRYGAMRSETPERRPDASDAAPPDPRD